MVSGPTLNSVPLKRISRCTSNPPLPVLKAFTGRFVATVCVTVVPAKWSVNAGFV